MHRVGGIEKEDGTGNISYDPANHDKMTRLRAAKVAGIADDIPLVDLDDPGGADLLVLSWGGTWGATTEAIRQVRAQGKLAAHAHLRHMNPFPRDLGEVLGRYSQVLVPELNLGQLSRLVRARVPRGREELHAGRRRSLPRVRARARDPGDDEVVTDGNGNGTSGNGAGTAVKLARKDFQSDQEVRWCPGCGDYGILTAIQLLLPETGRRPENLVFVSGIGCAARLPYYMNTYGVHSIHGRAPAIATGVALARPDLDVWVIGGDGDMLSIGGNHLIHALRRNVNLNILMFNNQIYGLTKGQYSPTSEVGKITKSTPFGSLDHPFNPVSIALGAEASFVARTHDMDRKHMTETFRRAQEHDGAAFVEVYQNCNVFNDGAFDTILNKDARPDMLIDLKHGEPVRFGADGEHGVVMNEFGEAKIVDVADVGVDKLIVHDETRSDPSLAFALSRLAEHPETPTPVGVFRAVDRPAYGVAMQRQLAEAAEMSGPGDLARALAFSADLDRLVAHSIEGTEHHPRTGLGPKEGRLLRHPDAVHGRCSRVGDRHG